MTVLQNDRSGFVYFFKSNDSGRIKIGFSIDPIDRLKGLSTASPMGLSILAVLPGCLATERYLLDRFGNCRLSGEWFKPEPELMEFIGYIRAAFDKPIELVKAGRTPPSRKGISYNKDVQAAIDALKSIPRLQDESIRRWLLRLAGEMRTDYNRLYNIFYGRARMIGATELNALQALAISKRAA